MEGPRPDPPGGGSIFGELGRCLRFFGRLPVPALPGETAPHAPPDLRRAAAILPVVGAILALPAALVLVLALRLGLGTFLSAGLALAALALATGALHEDGLADVADGFGGGATPERRLAIMRDSRIGAFGALALVLATLIRLGALAGLGERAGGLGAAAALVAGAALGRAGATLPLALLPPARADGLARLVGRPRAGAQIFGAAIAAVLWAGAAIAAGGGPTAFVLPPLLSGAVALALARLAARAIGGHTGDVAGAALILAEGAAWIGLLIALA